MVLQPSQPIINQEAIQEQSSFNQKKELTVEPIKFMQGTLEKDTLKDN